MLGFTNDSRTSLLSQLSSVALNRNPISEIQQSLDSAFQSFTHSLTRPETVLPFMLGSNVFQMTRFGFLSLSRELRFFQTGISPLLSQVFALSAEVSTVRCAQQALTPTHLSSSWWLDFSNFGILKGVGYLFQGSSIILSHLSQDAAMVLSSRAFHEISSNSAQAQPFLLEMLNAEALNLHLSLSTAFMHRSLGVPFQFHQVLESGIRRYSEPIHTSSPLLLATAGMFSINHIPEQVFAFEGRAHEEGMRSSEPKREPILTAEAHDQLMNEALEWMNRPGYMEGSREELLERNLPHSIADPLWFYALKDALGEDFSQCLELDLVLDQDRLAYSDHGIRTVQEALQKTQTQHNAGSIQNRVIRIPIQVIERFREKVQEGAQFLDIHYMMQQFILKPNPQNESFIDIFSFSFFENLYESYERQQRITRGHYDSKNYTPLRYFYIDSIISRDAIMHLRQNRLVPVGMTMQKINLHNARDQPPFILMIHDAVTHYFMSSAVYEKETYHIGEIYFRVRDHFRRNDFTESLLDSLSDFEYLNDPVIWKDTLKCRSQDTEIRQIYLEDLRSWLNSGTIPSSDIENAVRTLIEEMSTPVSDSPDLSEPNLSSSNL
ncbi:MAG: hypothetical protein JNK65_05775 [Deltaproteobacteria bacterium]|nr:hypothetical protein [Deltaproteobacteria bacterium]